MNLFKCSRKSFSIIELMTVILVILLLISLLIPTFLYLKKNARSAICKSQLRQMSILFTSYITENNGYFPNDNITDINLTANSNNGMYYGWNGHLLPYLDSGISSYNQKSRLAVNDGKIYVDTGGGWWYEKNSSEEAKSSLGNVNDGGWIIINDAFQKGGYNDLKSFICPEVHTNTYDVGVSVDFNGLKIPRIIHLRNGYVPTSYLANDLFFGWDGEYRKNAKSLRLDEITEISKKALLVEGGLAYGKGGNGIGELAYYTIGDLTTPYGGITKKETGGHRMNFVHDNKDKFWIMNSAWYVYYFPAWNVDGLELATKFNSSFAGKAEMIVALNMYGKDYFSIISYVDPDNGAIFKDFFQANPPGVGLANFVEFFEPEFHYLTGEMNVLFGDGAVSTKSQPWLSINRVLVGSLTSE